MRLHPPGEGILITFTENAHFVQDSEDVMLFVGRKVKSGAVLSASMYSLHVRNFVLVYSGYACLSVRL